MLGELEASNALYVHDLAGTHHLHHFCVCALNSIVSPFVLHDVAIEAAQHLSRNNPGLVMQHLRTALLPLVSKCQQMYIQWECENVRPLTNLETLETLIGLMKSVSILSRIHYEGSSHSGRATIPCRRSVIENVGVELPDGVLIYCGYSTSIRLQATDVDPFFSNTTRVQLLVTPTNSPTHYPNNGGNPSFLDFGISKGLTNLTEMVVIDAFISDHLPIYLDIRDLKRTQTNDFRYSYENFDFREYRKRLQDLTRIPNQLDTVEALELAVKGLTRNIQQTQQVLAKIVPNRPRRDNLPEEILNLVKTKNRISKRWQRFRQSADRIRAAELARDI
ncbi:hypothetical protein YQE_02611, partial [Dendroctonus ponderosae]